MYDIVVYETESGNAPLKKFLNSLAQDGDQKQLAQINAYISRLESFGMDINNEFPESVKRIRDEIFELRPGKNRIFFFGITKENKFVLLHGFKKKTRKTPKSEIQRAEKEWKDYIRRLKKMKELTFSELWESIKDENENDRTVLDNAEDISQLINNIVTARINLNMTQKDLADKCGLKQSAIARMENLKSMPRLDTIIKIARQVNLKFVTEPVQESTSFAYHIIEQPYEEVITVWGNIPDSVLV